MRRSLSGIPDEEFKAASCEGKEGFPSITVPKAIVKRQNKQGRSLQVYRCSYCRMFHISGKRR